MLLWDLLQGRIAGWLRVMVVVVLAPACAFATTVISGAAGLGLASALGPETPPAPTEQTAEENLERTSAQRRDTEETTTERSASPSATPSSSPTASSTVSPTATASPSASPSP